MTHETEQIDPTATNGASVASVGLSPAETSGAPPRFVPRDELLFWTEAWLAGEAESAKEREAGNIVEFGSPLELLQWLQADE